MYNRTMQEMIKNGEALDVRQIGKPIAGVPGKYELALFEEDVDYCDATLELWIWSIGKHKNEGTIIASLASDMYQNPDYECLWLR